MIDPTKEIPSWTVELERECLAKLASQVPAGGHILEIGALYGGTTKVLAQSAPQAQVTTIDEFSWTPEGYPTPTKDMLESHLAEVGVANVTVVEGKSEHIGKLWNKHSDLCFIDGGHSYEYVYADLCNFAPHCDVVACHDYDNPAWATIRKAIEDFLFYHPEWYLSETAGTVAVLRRSNAKVFKTIHDINYWGSDETVSGSGSTLEEASKMVSLLPKLFKKYKVISFLDAGCGDLNWMKTVNMKGIQYHGCDVVEDIVENNKKNGAKGQLFVADIITDELPDVDMILCRCTLFHLSFHNVQLAIENMRKHCKYLMLTTHPNQAENIDISNGDFRRLNLCASPIGLPEPIAIYPDGITDDSSIGVWKGEL